MAHTPTPPSEPDAAPEYGSSASGVKPAPFQLASLRHLSYHGFITDRDGETLELEADHRRQCRDRQECLIR